MGKQKLCYGILHLTFALKHDPNNFECPFFAVVYILYRLFATAIFILLNNN